MVATRHMESEKDSLPVDVSRSKTSLLKNSLIPPPLPPAPPARKKVIVSDWERGSQNRESERKAPLAG